EIVVWDLQSGQLVRTIANQPAVQALVFRPGTGTLISGSSDALVRFWDIETGSLRHTLAEHAEPITSISLSADGRRMASTSARQKKDYTWEGETLVWDLADLTLIRKLPGIRSVAIDPSGLRLAYRATEARTANGKTAQYSFVRLEPISATDQADADAIEFDAGVCTFSPDRSHIALSHDGIEIWSLAEKQRRFHFRVYGGMQLAFSPDGARVAYAVHGTDRVRDRSPDSVVVRNLQTGARERIFPWYQSRITGVAFTPDGLSLVTTDAENVKVWDISPTADPTDEILKQIRQMNVGPRDWPQWGGSWSKVNAPAGDHIPTTWKLGTIDSQTGAWRRDGSQNVKWAAQLGSQTYGNPVVANGRVFVGTNNGNGYLKRYPNRVDLGVLLCFDEATGEFLWQHSNEKLPTGRVHDWPLQGVCSTPSVDGDRLWYVTNRGEVVCLDTQGFADGEDDGPVQGVRRRLFAVLSDLGRSANAGAQQSSTLEEQALQMHLSSLRLSAPLGWTMWRKLPNLNAWELLKDRLDPNTRRVTGKTVVARVAIEEGEMRVWSVSDDVVGEQLAAVSVDLVAGLDAGNPGEALRRLLAVRSINLPTECAVEITEPGRAWRIRNLPSLGIELYLRREGAALVCEAEILNREHEADVVWKLDMMSALGVSQHNMSNCSPLIVGDWLFVCTSNGVDEGHQHIPAPNAPSFIALDRWTGKVLWTDNSPGTNILHAQWASPSYGVFGGQPQVIFPGGDGWVYSFDPRGDGQGHSKLLWKFDGNFKDSKYLLGGRSTRNHIIAFPAIYDGLVYIVMGEDPEHGEGPGCLWCLDPAKGTGGVDISESLAVDAEGHPIPHRRLQAVDSARGEKAIPNPNSAVVWRYTAQDRNGDGVIVFEEEFHRSLSVPVIKDDILYVADFSGLFHCLNAKTGKVYWTYDMFAACWNSALLVDGKVFIGDEDGDLAIFRHSPDPEKAMKKGEPWFGEPNLSTSIYMTPIVANNVLYIATKSMLYAIQQPKVDAPFDPLPEEEMP
ncbi:MAG TPA: PQQ-binding-like beta-propeller repeat protein, partial [Planctomycetaceae bacterium]|nr:PQQ-binding-like beta-propeller repeat protein [Planctomycetaceae bacterium]